MGVKLWVVLMVMKKVISVFNKVVNIVNEILVIRVCKSCFSVFWLMLGCKNIVFRLRFKLCKVLMMFRLVLLSVINE